MSTLLDRVEEVAKNPAVEFERDKGRYKFKAETIAEWLQITEEEALQLPNLSIPPVGVSIKEWKGQRVKKQLLGLRRQAHGWQRDKTREAVEERMAKILVALQEGPKTLQELMDLTGLKEWAVKQYIRKLRERGYHIAAHPKAQKGSRGVDRWLYLYVPTVQIA